MESLSIVTVSEAETRRVGALLGAALEPGDVLALRGELGTGKTALARGIAAGAGSRDRVRSPTFTLVHRYEGGRVPIVHVDAYRLAGPEELVALGIEEIFDPAAATLVEWAERVEAALPRERLDVVLAHRARSRRALDFRACGARPGRLIDALVRGIEKEVPPP
jgi:tRNA threonylcarbamoyladenosine biosynthesis protein TsaE